MSTVTLAALLLIRVILPVGLLVTVGEWLRRREERYWLHR
jgi:hypothetical protein